MKSKKAKKIQTSEFWYDLLDNEYITPEKVLSDKEDIERVQEAIDTLRLFYDTCIDSGIVEEI